jgi:hypothetical protein
MTYVVRVCASLALLAAVAAVSLCASSCLVGGGSCNCPSNGGYVGLPIDADAGMDGAAPPVMIASLSTDPGCTANSGSDGSVTVFRGSAGTCRVQAQLTNGDIYVFTMTFRSLGGCCSSLFRGTVTSGPQLFATGDGGTD